MYVRLYVRKYDEDYKKKMKISFFVFLIILTFAALLNGNLGLLSIPIFLALLFLLFGTILPRDFKFRNNLSKKFSRMEPKPVDIIFQ
ncbi:MAG: hypothetical protein ACTSWK_14335 [Promethearchaeota archaeon]